MTLDELRVIAAKFAAVVKDDSYPLQLRVAAVEAGLAILKMEIALLEATSR